MSGIKNSAQWRFTAIAVLLPIAAVAVLLVWQDYQARRSSIITNLELKSVQINAQLQDFVNSAEASTGSLATLISTVRADIPQSSPKTAGTLTSPDELLVNFLERNRRFTEVAIVDASGNTLAGSRPFTTGSRSDYAEFLGSQGEENLFAVSNVFVPEGEAEPYALFSYRLETTVESSSYVVASSLLTTISGALDMSTGFPTSAKSGIFDGSGRILAGTGYELPHPGGAVGRDVSGSAVWAQVENGTNGAWFGPGLDKVDRIIFFESPGKTPWITTVAFAQEELFGPLWNRVWIVSGGLLATIVGTLLMVEIARRRERLAWQQVSRERRTLQAVLDNAPDGILVMDDSGAVEYANRRLGDLFRIAPEQLIGVTNSRVCDAFDSTPGLTQSERDDLRQLLTVEEPLIQSLNVGGPDDCAIQVVAYPVHHSNGQRAGLTLVAHDVTEEARIQRMKSEFVGNASHQLRTPLASILASSELLLNGSTDLAKRDARLRLIHHEALRMRETITSLLNLSQIESGRISLKSQSISLKAVLDDATKAAAGRSESHDFAVDIADDVDHVWADRSKLAEVMSNLIDNAVKYSPDGGKVSINAFQRDDSAVVVQVKDQGVGIAESDLPLLFSPFHRASANARGLADGTGLGLHIAHVLVELMGGELSVESAIGIGSTFILTVPNASEHRVERQVEVDGGRTGENSFSAAITQAN